MFKNKDGFVKIEKKSGLLSQLAAYTFLFIIIALGVYLAFIVCDRTLLRYTGGNMDGIAQAYPSYMNIKNTVYGWMSGEDVEAWSWCIGLGGDYFDYFKSKLINPLTYVITSFPEQYVDIGYNIATVLRQYLSGIAFLFFAREVDLRGNQTVTGAVCYAFSAWMVMVAVNQAHFLNATMYFPLLIMGAEQVLKKKNPVLFIISVCLMLTAGVQWGYIGGIVVILYFCVRFVCMERLPEDRGIKAFVIEFLKFMGYGIVGILLSSFFVFSILYSMTNATTESQYDPYGMIYSIRNYLTMFTGFFEYSDIHAPYSYVFGTIICTIAVPLIVMNIKKKSTPAIFAVGLFILGLLPFTGSVLNGFSYSSGRWYFVFVFFFVWAAMECLDAETLRKKKNYIIMLAWLALLGIWNIGVCYLGLKIINVNSVLATVIGCVFGTMIIALLYARVNFVKFQKGPLKQITGFVIVMILSGSIIGAANMEFYPGVSDTLYGYANTGLMYEKFENSSQRVVQDLQREDDSFFRTDQVDGHSTKRVCRVQVNENILYGNRSIYTYFSTMDSKWHMFNKAMGNNSGYFDRTTSFSNDNRAALDFLMGVKYFLGDNEAKKEGATEYAPYGFEYYKTIDGVDVLKNKYYMGLGTAYRQYITESELEEYQPLVREQVLMQAAVVPDDFEAENQGLRHAAKSDIKTEIEEVEYKIENPESMTVGGGKMTITGKEGSFDLVLPEIKDRQVIIAFENLQREKMDYKTSLQMSGKDLEAIDTGSVNFRLKEEAYTDDEKFTIKAQKGKVKKSAMNRKSKSQGFSDVVDFNINLGYYESVDGAVKITINRIGNYTYDNIRVYTVPMNVYDENAQILEDSRYEIEYFDGDYVKGTVDAEKDSVMYFSILNTPGWKIYIDGVEQEKIDNVNLAFTGAEIGKGEHTVELKYSHMGTETALWLTIAGIICLAGIIAFRCIRRKE